MIKHQDMFQDFQDTQYAESDIREKCREQIGALYARGGQWEQKIWNIMAGRPRYQYDHITPAIDQIDGSMSRASFDIKTSPASNSATRHVGRLYDGIIRHIENISQAKLKVFNPMKRTAIESGFDSCRVVNTYYEKDSFNQDLMIKPIHNSLDRVWFDPASRERDRSDADWCVVLTPLTPDEFKKKFPKAKYKGTSGVSSSRWNTLWAYKHENILVGEYLYKKQRKKTIALLTNGWVVDVDENYDNILQEIYSLGITEVQRRDVEQDYVCSKYFDDNDWLSDSEEFVFEYIPIIPEYANFKVVENNKSIYFGLTEKLLDPQRNINYSGSRITEDSALKPRNKIWMLASQGESYKGDIETLNTNNKPVQFIDWEEGQPLPQFMQLPGPDPSLVTITNTNSEYINKISGLFAANMGDNPRTQSGIAIDKQIDQGNIGFWKYFEGHAIMIAHVGRVLVNAIPKIYNDREVVRIVGRDGKESFESLSYTMVNPQTGRSVVVRDLSQGQYDVICHIGPSYANKQQETIDKLEKLAPYDQSIIPMSSDVLLDNMGGVGTDIIRDRKRLEMLKAGLIPESQMTEEERQMAAQMAQAQANQPPSPQEQAAIALSQAEQKRVEAETVDTMSKAQERESKSRLEDLRFRRDLIKLQMEKLKLDSQIDEIDSRSLKNMKDATGADAIMHSGTMAAYDKKARDLNTENTLDQEGILGNTLTGAVNPEMEEIDDGTTGI